MWTELQTLAVLWPLFSTSIYGSSAQVYNSVSSIINHCAVLTPSGSSFISLEELLEMMGMFIERQQRTVRENSLKYFLKSKICFENETYDSSSLSMGIANCARL